MRDYAKVLPTFWTRGKGKLLRGDRDAQLLALYLFSAPASTMLGLYYCPLATICHETGIPSEGATKALRRLGEVGIAFFDPEDDLVWLPGGVTISVGPSLARGDNRCKGLSNDLARFGNHAFSRALLHRYQASHHLAVEGLTAEPLTKPLSKALTKPLRSQDQDQDQDQEQEQEGCGEPQLTLQPATPQPPVASHGSAAGTSPELRDSLPETGASKGKGEKPDLPASELSPPEAEIVAAILADPDLAPIVKRPGRLARDLLAVAPGLDIPHEVRSLGAWTRANPTKAPKSNGNSFLLRNLRRRQDDGGARGPMRQAPPQPESLLRSIHDDPNCTPAHPPPKGGPPVPPAILRAVRAMELSGVDPREELKRATARLDRATARGLR